MTIVHEPFGTTEWWRTAVIYQVYPRSFADGNGDGIGDLPGVTARLEHLAALGVDAVWLSPFYRSPQRDAGYDVADYRDVDPLFGTLDDADAMIARAHELGLRVIVDLVPNHTSSEHAWFQAALAAAPGSPERGRYLFRDGQGESGELPPNNWRSIFGGPAWTRVPDPAGAGQWYLHLFDSSQPDLDWTNPEVRAELEDVLRFWLRRGVDGFRVDVAHGLVKADGLPDWDGTVEMVAGTDPGAPEDGQSPAFGSGPMFDQDGVHDVYRAWRRVLDEFDADGERRSRALVAEAWVEPPARLARYVRDDEMQQAFNFSFLTSLWDAAEYRRWITESLESLDAVGAPTTWVLSNHDVVRHPSRFGLPVPGTRTNGIFAHQTQPDEELGLRRGRAATLFMLALPGSAYLYQGEELGLPEHTTLPDDVREDPSYFRTGHAEAGRDGCRVPIPWSAHEPGFGFSPTGRTWLPQPESWAAYAADAQTGVKGSTLELYRSALALRREHTLGAGGMEWVEGYPDDVLAFRTSRPDGAGVVVVANLGTTPVALPAGAKVLLASADLADDGALPADVAVWLRG
ncbi:alpha amylase catalytic region [Xylanimonas cellulosilytica DSM 15894]|uniref:Alpha amylase catalytic region n=1 Tax=Xylanimonas cellulosilytica (strain DSM 15894 / JCM 12276 / CECT 5975 / KCTC 9989 / LMG 20990 / NBRC 107835 / XIL07) TaxID=446471 RepID=D1BUG9_XYLCX|nr:glycoside hydrolase family 13 protein [Xylanimonas cellulosilytica]ACZ31182.1 alpha amylase catalytic region [Xylanimonas cellulosilytica DSM 15894]